MAAGGSRTAVDGSGTVLVGIGATAAAPRSLETLLISLPQDARIATIAVMQQREALDERAFRQRLENAGLTITPVAHGADIEGGRIYLPPPNLLVTVQDGKFVTRQAQEAPGERGTIDSFLLSLADHAKERAVAVLLSGTGADGTLGVTAIKEAGGLAVAETPEDPEHLATSNSPAAIVDFILPPNQIGECVARYARDITDRKITDLSIATPDVDSALAAIATVLRNKTGHDFHGYKQNTFLRRVQRRMHVAQTDTLQAYLEFLRSNADEAQQLFQDLLIGVTQFFRDKKEFALLESEVVPKLFDGKGPNDQVRVWVLGCASGEEAYSIGILLLEQMARLDSLPQVQIFATDLDGRALAAARAGRFSEAAVKDVPRERLARWFVHEGDTYVVVKELREMCIFSQHNVIRDAPFSRLDLISCRNLLIYLNADLQQRVIPLFHFALRPGGYLFLGSAENVTRHSDLFAPIEGRFRIYRRIETGTRVLPEFPFGAGERRIAEASVPPRRTPPDTGLARRAERIAERYAPAFVVTDDAFDVLHFSGRTGRFIDPAGGAASLNLMTLLHPDLRLDVRGALARAGELKQAVTAERIPVRLNGERQLVDIVVEPIDSGTGGTRQFVILFKDGPVLPTDAAAEATPPQVQSEHVQRLESELRVTGERLQATIEELESTNEELKSSNEEYQSLNEELQSANEELETSKEELQSVNEELTTVNGELAHRVQELGRANSDLKNLLESTQIATIFLNNDLRVMNFTPSVADLFHLIESDVGRPIAHIKSRIVYEELQEDVRRVMRTLGSTEREVENAARGTRYIARVLPYRSTDNFIAGAVVTFTDITRVTRAERAVRESEARLRFLADAGAALVSTLDYEAALRQVAALAVRSFTDVCFIDLAGEEGTLRRVAWAHRNAGKAIGMDEAALHAPAPNAQRHVATKVMSSGEPVFSAKVDDLWAQGVATNADDLAFLRMLNVHSIISVPLKVANDTIGALTVARSEDPAQAHSEADLQTALELGRRAGLAIEHARQHEVLRKRTIQQRVYLAELQHRVRNTLAVVRSIARRTAENSSSVEDYHAHFDGRLSAFARTQAEVTRDPTSGVMLEYLVAEELLAHGAREGEQVEISGPPIRLRDKAVELLGLAVHELATNAIKYGAFSQPQARVKIRWQVNGADGAQWLVLEWKEEGVQIDGEPLARRGFGTELLQRTLGYELGSEARLQHEKDGLRWIIRIPMNERLIHLAAAE